ncbi:MAG: type II toxin-antitoxin system Phd/YefM family antitoxin [Anaerolineae bacterium]
MPIETTYTKAREGLATLLDRVTQDHEVVIIRRRSAGDVAMVAAEDLESLLETVYLLRSPRNAERLLSAIARAEAGEGERLSLEELESEVGLAGER